MAKKRPANPPNPLDGWAAEWFDETVKYLERARAAAGVAYAKAKYAAKLTGEQKYVGEAEYHRHCSRYVGALLSAARGHARLLSEGGPNGAG